MAVDARNKRLQYNYDVQGRLTSAVKFDWNGSTWVNAGNAVVMTYDTAPIQYLPGFVAKGLLATVNGESYEYTAKGRVSKKTMPWGTAGGLSAQFAWGPFGELTGMTYPRTALYNASSYSATQYEETTASFAYDVQGRPLNAGASNVHAGLAGSGNQTMAHSAQYNAAGALASVALIGGTQTYAYNALGQMTRLTVPEAIDIEYQYSATANDGRAVGQKNWLSGEEVQYTYDSLARLTKAETVGPGWGQAFGYDDWGNLYSKSVTKGSAPTLSVAIDGWTNRITGAGFGYDGAGNMTSMPVAGGTQTLTYDHHSRVTAATNPSGTENYNYDLLNRRMLRTRGSTTDIFFYGAMGELLGRYRAKQFTQASNGMTIAGPQCEEMYFYFAGRRVAKRAGSASLGFWGSPSYGWIQRLQGDRAESVGDGSTYYPYGEEKTATANDTHKFATYYRDAGSGLDYAHHRYYASTYGRFTSADPYRASGGPADPGSWNRYAYVGGDPVNANDPSGLSWNSIWWGGGGFGVEAMADLYGPLGGSGGGGDWCPAVFGWAPGTFCALQVALPIAAIGLGESAEAEPECELELWARPAPLGWNHAYLRLIRNTNGKRTEEIAKLAPSATRLLTGVI